MGEGEAAGEVMEGDFLECVEANLELADSNVELRLRIAALEEALGDLIAAVDSYDNLDDQGITIFDIEVVKARRVLMGKADDAD